MKKYISFILLLAIVLSSFCMPSFAQQAQNAKSNTGFLRMLDICENENLKDSDILTRIELSKMFYKILTGNPLPEYTEYQSPYEDIGEEEYGYVKLVSEAGIMTGISNTYFGKDEPVTYIQLLKTVVTLLGYNTHAVSLGGWPVGYYTMAAQLGLTQNSPADINFYVTLSGAADVFRLAANAEMTVRTSFTDDENYEAYKGYGFLEYYMGIVPIDGIVNASSTASIDGTAPCEFGKVKIGSREMLLSQKAIGIYGLLGQSVTVFCNKKSSVYEVKYFEALNDDVKYISADKISNVTNGTIEYIENDKEYTAKYTSGTSVVYNGRLAKSYTTSTINPFVLNSLDGGITLIDNNSDKIIDTILVDAYQTFLCGGVRDMVAISKIVSGKLADFSEFGENSLAILNAVGEPISYKDIAEDDVLNCYYDLKGTLTKIVVTIDYGSGTIEEIVNDGTSVKSLYISGKKYDCAQALSLCPDYASLKPGDEVTFWFNKEAKIAVIQKGVESTKLALVTDIGKMDGLDSKYYIKLFEAGGLFSEHALADKIKVNSSATVEPKDFEAFLGTTSGRVKRQLIKYGLNENNEVNRVTVADSSKDANGKYATDFFIYDGFDGTSNKQYREELYTFGLKLYLESSTKVFVIPPEENRDTDDAYAIKSRGTFNNNNYKVTAYGSDKNSPVADAIIYVGTVSSNPSSSTKYFAVSSVIQSIDENGEEFVKVSGFFGDTGAKGTSGYIKAESMGVLKKGPNGELVESGDIIKYTTDATGLVNGVTLILDKSENKLHNMNNPNGAFPATGIRYAYGDVISNDGSYITIECKDIDGTLTTESYPIYRFTESSVTGTVNERTGEVSYKAAKASHIFDRESYGSKCTKAFVNVNGPWWIVGILYN